MSNLLLSYNLMIINQLYLTKDLIEPLLTLLYFLQLAGIQKRKTFAPLSHWRDRTIIILNKFEQNCPNFNPANVAVYFFEISYISYECIKAVHHVWVHSKFFRWKIDTSRILIGTDKWKTSYTNPEIQPSHER